MKRIPLRVAVSVRRHGKSLSVRTKACNGRVTKRPRNEFGSNKTREPENPSKFSPARSAAKKREGVKKTPSLS